MWCSERIVNCRYYAGIASVVAKLIQKVQSSSECDKRRMILLSGHDDNLLNVWALLGLRPLRWPSYSAYWVLEIFHDHVKFCFNWDAVNNPAKEVLAVALESETVQPCVVMQPGCLGLGYGASTTHAVNMQDQAIFFNDQNVNTEWLINTLTAFNGNMTTAEIDSTDAMFASILESSVRRNVDL